MIEENNGFKIDFLDHVAIRVKDLSLSAAWYGNVLGLKKYQLPEWGDYPIFMLTNKTGVALFPTKISDTEVDPKVKIDHFAFNVNQENFLKAQKRFETLGIEFSIQDHHYFHSIYIKDPDGHTVELTTLIGASEGFYKFT